MVWVAMTPSAPQVLTGETLFAGEPFRHFRTPLGEHCTLVDAYGVRAAVIQFWLFNFGYSMGLKRAPRFFGIDLCEGQLKHPYRGVIRPPSLSCSPPDTLGNLVE